MSPVKLSLPANQFKDVKKSTINQFVRIAVPEDNIHSAVTATINNDEMPKYVWEINSHYAKAQFNDEIKFGQLRQAVMIMTELAQFEIFLWENICAGLGKEVMGFRKGCLAYNDTNTEIAT